MKLHELIIKLQSIEDRLGGDLDCFVNDAYGKWAKCDPCGTYTFDKQTVFICPTVSQNQLMEPLLDESESLLF